MWVAPVSVLTLRILNATRMGSGTSCPRPERNGPPRAPRLMNGSPSRPRRPFKSVLDDDRRRLMEAVKVIPRLAARPTTVYVKSTCFSSLSTSATEYSLTVHSLPTFGLPLKLGKSRAN